MGVTYRGRHSDDFGLAVQTNPHILPEFENNTVSVPGMDGAHYVDSNYGMRLIPVTIAFVGDDIHDYESRLYQLANWIRPDEGPGIYESDNNPGIYHYAALQSEGFSRLRNIAKMGEGDLIFVCPDPFGYGLEQTFNLSNHMTINNEGTKETYPIFDLTVTKDSSRISITNESNTTPSGTPKAIVLGQETQIDEEPIEKKKLVLHDTMQSTANWQGATEVDSGYVSGSMATDSEGFYVDEWGDEDGEGPGGWIGPSLQRSLPQSLDSFIADIYMENNNETDLDGNEVDEAGVGIVEVYFRDANGNKVCKLQFGDQFSNAHENTGIFDTDGKRYPARHNNPGGWNDFRGILRIRRDMGYYYPYFALVQENGRHTDRRALSRIIPMPGIPENPVTDIQVAMRKWYGARRIYMRINEIRVYDTIGEFEYPDTPDIKFKQGDKLHIDVAKGLVLLNGEVRTDLFNLDTIFWDLVEGDNILKVSDNVEGTVSYAERYL